MPRRAELIGIAAILMATISLSVDIMLPALATIAADLGAVDNQRQWVVTALFIGLTIGQLIFGPLSDSTGRRPAIFVGIALFTLGSVLCATATSFSGLIAGRILQGIGAAGPRIVTVAIIRDRFAGPAMAQVMSIIMGIFILVPMLAPALGQGLLVVISWRALFALLPALCIAGGVWLFLRQPETLAAPRPFSARALITAAREVLTSPKPMAYTLAGAGCYGSMMGYVNSSQQLFQDLYGAGHLFAALFGLCAAFIAAATLINARLVLRFGMEGICIAAMTALLLWCAGFWALAAITGAAVPLWGFMLFNCVTLFLMGLTFGNFNAIALANLGHIAGLASAILASLTTALNLMIAAVIGLSFNMTAYPIAIGYTVCAVVSLTLMLWARRKD
ncbi:multidrug effflux MFS transporter [Pseudorhodobacter antarcticus]|nr:multidrug effflux MFS transporter [Pseudorhodobacter antarcticus]